MRFFERVAVQTHVETEIAPNIPTPPTDVRVAKRPFAAGGLTVLSEC